MDLSAHSDRDGDGEPDCSDTCPDDATNSCFAACMALELTPTFWQAAACIAAGGAVAGALVAATGGVAALAGGSVFLDAAYGAGFALSGAAASWACACAFKMWG